MIATLPIRPDGVNHHLGFGDSGFDRRVVSNVYDQNPDFMAELELSLDFLQLLLGPPRDSEREWDRTETFRVRVEVLGYVFPGEAWYSRNQF